MASLNVDAGVSELSAKDQTGASRETSGNRAFESLFGGLGDLVTGVTKTVDNNIKTNIEKDARTAFDSLNDEVGMSPNTVPIDIVSSKETLQKLADAHSQGKVSEPYYYQRLSATLKSLRTKYPGYEAEVDDIVQSVTGTRPANAFRDALFQNMRDAENEAKSQAGKFDTWANQNQETLGILYPDFYENPDKYASDEARRDVKSKVMQYQGRLQEREDLVKLQSNDKAIALPAAGRLFGTVVQGYIVGGSETVGIGDSVQTKIDAALSDGKITPEEKSAIVGYVSQLKSKATMDLRKRVQESEWGANFGPDEVNKLIAESLKPLDEMQTLISQDDLQSASQIAARNKAIVEESTAEIYKQFPELATAAAVKPFSQVAADTITTDIIEKSGGGQAFTNRILGKDLASGITSGTITLTRISDALGSTSGKSKREKEQILSQVLDAASSTLAAPGASPEIKKNTVKNVYSDRLDKTWGQVSSDSSSGSSQKMRLFHKMFNPAITKEIATLNDPESMKTYVAAAYDKFQQIPEFRQAGANLNEALSWSEYTRVNYDKDRNRLVVEVNEEAMKNAGNSVLNQTAIRDQVIKATTAFNQALDVMAPIIEASGGDELEGVASLTKTIATNFDTEHQKGFFWHLNDGINRLITGNLDVEGGVAKPGSKLYEAGKDRNQSYEDSINPDNGDWKEISADGTVESKIFYASSDNKTLTEDVKNASNSYIQYANRNKTRNLPLSDKLTSALSFLSEMGLTARVESGGQPGIGTSDRRTGSTRHDHGNAADVDFYDKNGRKLNWNNPDDLETFKEIVRRGKKAGLTGFGAGDDYMGNGRMHVGFGTALVWGAKGKPGNAPAWLKQAYYE